MSAAATSTEWDIEFLDLTAYLARVGYDGDRAPTARTLRDLHLAHTAAIPFENLDIPLGHGIRLDLAGLQDKLVHRSRGGYCYEQNLLFAAVLERLGFGVTRLLARIRNGSDKIRPRSHATLRVEAEAEDGAGEGSVWLADVGFGGEGLLEPIPLTAGTPARQGGWSFRLDREDGGVWVLRSLHSGGWFDLYAFTLEAQPYADFVVSNYFTSTNPSSPFVGQAVVQRTSADARHSLRGRDLTVTRPDGSADHRTLTDEEFAGLLVTTFGIALDQADAMRALSGIDAPPAG
ncbi:arylamine N-acetyltransferase family protein [Actinomadura sp. HBU206391]|uniref:arylamine N-acetyltransferase family protein n=1 Tax=Actinomadura sp. HBU206391 TaxID=2731692 RepID=UPI00164F269E|nr:arylamine N-acetyltransferase [Actinomadura sp. HBU206391]MBC6461071.1 arylamine N-acetyltransferase [Actinomadura sp. HBU206391]